MANPTLPVVIPRPNFINNHVSIPGPSETAFTTQFGALLPSAKYISSYFGTTALYSFPPTLVSPTTPPQHILLLHGLGTPALGLLPLVRAILASNPHAHLTLYDLWGHGLSSTPLVPHVPGLFHAQVLRVLAALKWNSAHLIGFSFGGSTVASFSALHPEMVESVTLLAPAGLLRLKDFTAEQQAFIRGGEGVDEDAARKWMFAFTGELVVEEGWKERFATGDVFAGDPIQAWQRTEHQGHTASFVAMIRDGGLCDMHELFGVVGKSGLPTLAVIGELDDLCTEEDLRDAGFADVVVVKEGKHTLVRDKVSEVAGPINAFLERLATEGCKSTSFEGK